MPANSAFLRKFFNPLFCTYLRRKEVAEILNFARAYTRKSGFVFTISSGVFFFNLNPTKNIIWSYTNPKCSFLYNRVNRQGFKDCINHVQIYIFLYTLYQKYEYAETLILPSPPPKKKCTARSRHMLLKRTVSIISSDPPCKDSIINQGRKVRNFSRGA